MAWSAFLRRLTPTRFLFITLATALLLLLPTWLVLRGSFDTEEAHNALWAPGGGVGMPVAAYKAPLTPEEQIAELVLHGGVVMPKLGNETIKAELGRASWKLLRKFGSARRWPLADGHARSAQTQWLPDSQRSPTSLRRMRSTLLFTSSLACTRAVSST